MLKSSRIIYCECGESSGCSQPLQVHDSVQLDAYGVAVSIVQTGEQLVGDRLMPGNHEAAVSQLSDNGMSPASLGFEQEFGPVRSGPTTLPRTPQSLRVTVKLQLSVRPIGQVRQVPERSLSTLWEQGARPSEHGLFGALIGRLQTPATLAATTLCATTDIHDYANRVQVSLCRDSELR